MNRIILKSNAKINLGLNVTGKYKNGYHSLDMIMAPISLCDNLVIYLYDEESEVKEGEVKAGAGKEKEGKLEIKTNNILIPTGKSNIIHKIYDEFYKYLEIKSQYYFKKKRIDLFLEKNVPFEAGLGGGSSNGAIFLKYLNSLHENILTKKELNKIGSKIGADIPFFLNNVTSRVKGKGELLFPIENNLKVDILIIKPEFGISTKEAYENFEDNCKSEFKDANIEKIIEGFKTGDLSLVEKNIENHLEQNLLLKNQKILNFRNELDKLLPNKFFMTGSGSAYYTLLDKKKSYKILDTIFKEKSSSLLIDCKVKICNFL